MKTEETKNTKNTPIIVLEKRYWKEYNKLLAIVVELQELETTFDGIHDDILKLKDNSKEVE